MDAEAGQAAVTGNAELDALRLEAEADAGTASPGAGSEPGTAAAVPKAETWEDWRDGIQLALAWSPYPELEQVYTPAKVEALAKACHALAVKRNWTLSGLWLKWKEEITLAFVAVPLLRDTAKIIKAKREAAGQGAAPAGATAQSGTVRPAPDGALKATT